MRAVRPRLLPIAIVLLALVAAGCSADREDLDHPLAGRILEEVGGPYERVDGPSGPMDLDDAITSVGYISPTRVRRQLGRTGFQEGYARVWRDTPVETAEDEETAQRSFVTVLVFDFLSEGRAWDMIRFAVGELDELRGAQGFDVPGLDGGRGYTLNARAPGSSDPLFCQVVWFARGTSAFEVRTCDPTPGSTGKVEELAKQQVAKLRA